MAEWLRIPYLEIARAAALPAVVDQLALLGAVHLPALKHGIKGLPGEELPRFLPTFLSGLHYLIPVGVLLYYLIAREMTPLTSAFMATAWASGRAPVPGGPRMGFMLPSLASSLSLKTRASEVWRIRDQRRWELAGSRDLINRPDGRGRIAPQ